MKRAPLSLIAISLTLVALPARGAADQQSIAIRAGKIITVSGGVVKDGVVIVQNGKIDRVGTDLKPPKDVRLIDVREMTIAPGFIDAHSHLGLSLDVLGETDETVRPVAAEMRIIDAFDARADGLAEAIRSGVTTAVLAPGSKNPIGGQMAVVKLSGDGGILDESVAVKLSFSHDALMSDRRPTSLPGLITLVREHFDAGKAYSPRQFDPSAEVLHRVANRKLPAHVYAQSLDEIAAAFNVIDQYKLAAILVGARQADETAEMLVKREASVVFGPLLLYSKDKDLKRVAKLAQAGVKIAFASFAPQTRAGDIRTSAILAVRYGLDRDEALRALTVNPAAILGLAGRLGSIQKGLDADLVVFDGDPLEPSSQVEMVIIDGQIVYQRKQP